MAHPADPKKKNESGIYYSRYETNERWAKKNPSKMIGFRVQPEAAEKISNYLNQMAEKENAAFAELSEEEKLQFQRKFTTDLGRPSTATWLRNLIEADMHESLDE